MQNLELYVVDYNKIACIIAVDTYTTVLEIAKHTESMFIPLNKVIGYSTQVDLIQHIFVYAKHHEMVQPCLPHAAS